MKIVVRGFLICLLLIFGAAFLLQTPLAKNIVKRQLIQAAQSQNIHLEIEKLDGSLPLDLELKHVHIQYKEVDPFYFESIKIRLAFLPLLKKQIELSYVKGTGAKWREVPFTFLAKGKIDIEGNSPIKLSHFLIEGDDFFVRMDGKIQQDLQIQEGHLAFYLPDLAKFGAEGSLIGRGQVDKEGGHLEAFCEEGKIGSIPLASSSFILDAKRNMSWWEGTVALTGGHKKIPLVGNLLFRFTPSCRLLSIDRFAFEGSQLNIFGKLDLDPSLTCMEGSLFAKCDNLNIFRPFFPDSYLKGEVGAKVDFQSYSKMQDLKCQIEIENFSAFDVSATHLTMETNLFDLFGEVKGELTLVGDDLVAEDFQLAHVEFISTLEHGSSPYELAIQGTWKDPFQVRCRGQWQKRGKGLFLSTTDLDGYAFSKPFTLCEPFSVEWSGEHFKMSNFSLDIGEGHLFSRIDLTGSSSLIKVEASEFPLEFITLPYKHFSLEGLGSCDIDLVSWEDTIQGSCNIALKRALIRSTGATDVLTTKGSLQVHLNQNRAQIHGELKAKDRQFLHFFGSIPVTYQHFPFKVAPNPKESLSGEILAEGKLEDLFNFVNIGSHRIEGWLASKLYFSQTLENPSIRGSLHLEKGTYENYHTGTTLTNIQASARADKQTILIESLRANDSKEGSLKATGQLELAPEKNFPFSFSAQLKKLQTVSFDTIAGQFSGKVTISGDTSSSIAKGNLKVTKATFRIPDKMPAVLPELPITFINPPESIQRKKIPPPATSPLLLDLDVDIPHNAFVEGRGINAELQGKLHLSGSYTDIAANGTLQLINGEYIFSGKVFDLNQGELIFKDKPTSSAYISLTGTCDLPEVDVTISLRGPLSEPKLTLQSSPPLPTSSLLAQILFNKDISEISAIQALQIAQTVISLSGNPAPDILEKIRKTLGIDRLTLVTSENDPGKISLQIGKYLMRGVMLTLSQGVGNPNVSVEVDLKRGIKFQAELSENQQGKFSLKWHHHY